MKKQHQEIIKDNLRAYEANFEKLFIVEEDYGKGYYVYKNETEYRNGSWVQFCYNVDYLNGWLYGCVQAGNGIIKKEKCDVV